jgi:hypothetical protein
MVLDPAVDDQHLWTLSTSGKYSSKSAYVAFFHRIDHICTMETQLEKLGPTLFILLAVDVGQLTALLREV